mmetsp:Transcript_17430/g.39963  ORF Transcript_17430/g.39963 Transcript_17430/m.39963 type:complete len:460 (+) Transcript_17430:50-1429(+)
MAQEPANPFMNMNHPCGSAKKIHGHEPQTVFSGHIKPDVKSEDAVAYLKYHGYRSIVNIQESWEKEYVDLAAAANAAGICCVNLPCPKVDGEGMHEDKFTINLAHVTGLVLLGLPRPSMIMCRSAKRASAIWFFSHAVKHDLTSAQVMMLTADAGLPFVGDAPLLYWVARFMMQADEQRNRNRRIFGDIKVSAASELPAWSPTKHIEPEAEKFKSHPFASGRQRSTPDRYEMPGTCPFATVVFPGRVAQSFGYTEGKVPQTAFGTLRRVEGAVDWLTTHKFRAVLNLLPSDEEHFEALESAAQEAGLQHLHIPLPCPDNAGAEEVYTLNQARIVALSVLGLPRPLMIVSKQMHRASAAWVIAHATRYDLKSAEVEALSLAPEVNYRECPTLEKWVAAYMAEADKAQAEKRKVLGKIDIIGQEVEDWSIDLAAHGDRTGLLLGAAAVATAGAAVLLARRS